MLPHLILMINYPSSLMNYMALEGSFGADRYTDCSIHWVWDKVEKPVEDNYRDITHQTRRIIFYWYQMKFSEPAILSFEKSIAIKQLPHFTTLPQTQCIQSMDLSPPEVLSEPNKSGLLAHDSSSDTNEDRFIESDG